jgi:penicillin-binding protein 2
MLGFGRLTGINVSGEEAGILPSQEWKRTTQREVWYPGDTISVAIGQGYLAATPAQLATMMAAVARGTAPIPPRMIVGETPKPDRLPISEGTLRIVREALKLAVDEGTGRAATLGAFSVAGKTGTAQLTAASAGVDSDDLDKAIRDHAWFVGYAPAENPTIAFAIIVEHGGHGGAIAAPMAREVLEVYFGKDKKEEEQAQPEPEPASGDPTQTADARIGERRASLPTPR